jgi:hypothetical protein
MTLRNKSKGQLTFEPNFVEMVNTPSDSATFSAVLNTANYFWFMFPVSEARVVASRRFARPFSKFSESHLGDLGSFLSLGSDNFQKFFAEHYFLLSLP